MIDAPLTLLLKGNAKRIVRTILKHPNPEKPFTIEVDASESGVGVILLQRLGEKKLHSIAFFSKKLSLVERNYDVGNKELLAVQLMLEEWCHWLEGAKHSFTDNKNLEYIKAAKRLNPRQA